MKHNIISLDQIRDSELNTLQLELFEYATEQHGEMLIHILEDVQEGEYLLEDEEAAFTFFVTLWSIFSVQYDEQTIIKEFIAFKKQESKLRPSTLAQLEMWKEITPSFNLVKQVIDPSLIEVEDILTGSTKRVKLFEEDDVVQEGVLLLGFLLPYGNYDVYFSTFLDFEITDVTRIIELVRASYEEGDFPSAESFMRRNFPHIFLGLINGQIGDGPDIDQLHWEKEIYQEVAQLYKEFIEEEELPSPFYELGVMLWGIFCMKESPIIRKRENFAAALVYFIDKKVPFLDFYTKAEIARHFNISEGSVANAYRKLEKGLETEIANIIESLIHEGFSGYDEDGGRN